MPEPTLILTIVLSVLAIVAMCAAAVYVAVVRKRHMHLWLPEYCFPAERPPRVNETGPINVFLTLCDHYEPERGNVSLETALARVDRWNNEYPRTFGQFHDSRGQVPQHTFFFPQDEYRPEYLDRLAKLCELGFGDVDVHLHHDHDTADGLREKLESFRATLFYQHGLLRQDPDSGEIVYGFIHGNWALCNSRPDGRWCGVDNEITVLRETGCYADFTLPSAPSDTQTRTINSVYYARDLPGQRKSHDTGIRARVGEPPVSDGLLMVQGPLALDWGSRKYGVMPRTENGDLHGGRPATWRRFQLWLKAGVHVAGKPDWVFVKLYTHGCKENNTDTLFGPDMQQFHRDLASHAQRHPQFRYYYVTAWEMAQLIHQAEKGASEPQFATSSWPDLALSDQAAAQA